MASYALCYSYGKWHYSLVGVVGTTSYCVCGGDNFILCVCGGDNFICVCGGDNFILCVCGGDNFILCVCVGTTYHCVWVVWTTSHSECGGVDQDYTVTATFPQEPKLAKILREL